LVEPTGSETVLQLRLGVSEITAVVRQRVLAKPGETIRLRFEAVTHLFDPQTHQRIDA
jgi:multiple sugar transport system ATP-binding protein